MQHNLDIATRIHQFVGSRCNSQLQAVSSVLRLAVSQNQTLLCPWFTWWGKTVEAERRYWTVRSKRYRLLCRSIKAWNRAHLVCCIWTSKNFLCCEQQTTQLPMRTIELPCGVVVIASTFFSTTLGRSEHTSVCLRRSSPGGSPTRRSFSAIVFEPALSKPLARCRPSQPPYLCSTHQFLTAFSKPPC